MKEGDRMKDIYERNAAVMSALSTPIRLQILDLLSCGELCASAIQEYFSISQPTLSYHMKILTSSGIVSMRSEGKYVFYSLESERLKVFFKEVEMMVTEKKDCACHKALMAVCREA